MVRKIRNSPGAATRDPLDAVRRRLGRRPLTAAEAARMLGESGLETARIESAVQTLRRDGWLDDTRLAESYLSARAERLGHGRDRLLRELEQRGVDPALAERTWRRLVEDGDVDPDAILRRRLDACIARERTPLDPSALRRVYTTLLRAGFEPEAIRASLRPYRGDGPADPHDGEATETDDDAIC